MRSITWVWGPEHVAAALRGVELRLEDYFCVDVEDRDQAVAGRLAAKLRAYRPDESFTVTRAQLRVLEAALQDLADVVNDEARWPLSQELATAAAAAAELVEVFDEAHRLAESGVPRRQAGPRLQQVLNVIESQRSIFPLMPLEA